MDYSQLQTAPSDQEENLHNVQLGFEPNRDIHVSIPFESQTDALLASLVFVKPEMPLQVVDDFIALLRNPDFKAADLSFTCLEDILVRVSQYRQDVASARAMRSCTIVNTVKSSHTIPEACTGACRAVVPEDILDIIACHLFHERRSFVDVAQAQENAATKSQGRFILRTPCPRVRDLTNMSLAARSWCFPAQRLLQRSAKAVGSLGLWRVLLSSRASASLRELHVVLPSSFSEQSSNDLREALYLLRTLLNRVPNLESLYLQTSSPALHNYANQKVSAGLAGVFAVLAGLRSLRNLWLTHIPGPVLHAGNVNAVCFHLQELYTILPSLHALERLYLHNWCVAGAGTKGTMESVVESTSLNTLSFRLGANVVPFLNPHASNAASLSPLFDYAQSITHLHVVISNLFMQGSRHPSALFTELASISSHLTSLRLTIDTVDLDESLLSARLLASAAQLTCLTLVLDGPLVTLPQLLLPRTLCVLHVHISRTSSLEPSASHSLDENLSSMLVPFADTRTSEHTTHLKLMNVILTLEPTSSMRNEAERGFLSEARWEVEGLMPVPGASHICTQRRIKFECYHAELFSLSL